MRKLANKDHAKGFKTLSGLGSEALGWQFKDNGQTTIALAVFADNSELVEISTLPENRRRDRQKGPRLTPARNRF
jgi:hypothetical protein